MCVCGCMCAWMCVCVCVCRYVCVCLWVTLLYGAETWTTKAGHLQKLNTFHHQCVRSIVGIGRRQQWDDRTSTATLAATFGVDPDITRIIRRHRLRWLGHVGRMDDSCSPKQLLLGELPAPRPCHAPKKRWRNVVSTDLADLGVTTWL